MLQEMKTMLQRMRATLKRKTVAGKKVKAKVKVPVVTKRDVANDIIEYLMRTGSHLQSTVTLNDLVTVQRVVDFPTDIQLENMSVPDVLGLAKRSKQYIDSSTARRKYHVYLLGRIALLWRRNNPKKMPQFCASTGISMTNVMKYARFAYIVSTFPLLLQYQGGWKSVASAAWDVFRKVAVLPAEQIQVLQCSKPPEITATGVPSSALPALAFDVALRAFRLCLGQRALGTGVSDKVFDDVLRARDLAEREEILDQQLPVNVADDDDDAEVVRQVVAHLMNPWQELETEAPEMPMSTSSDSGLLRVWHTAFEGHLPDPVPVELDVTRPVHEVLSTINRVFEEMNLLPMIRTRHPASTPMTLDNTTMYAQFADGERMLVDGVHSTFADWKQRNCPDQTIHGVLLASKMVGGGAMIERIRKWYKTNKERTFDGSTLYNIPGIEQMGRPSNSREGRGTRVGYPGRGGTKVGPEPRRPPDAVQPPKQKYAAGVGAGAGSKRTPVKGDPTVGAQPVDALSEEAVPEYDPNSFSAREQRYLAEQRKRVDPTAAAPEYGKAYKGTGKYASKPPSAATIARWQRGEFESLADEDDSWNFGFDSLGLRKDGKPAAATPQTTPQTGTATVDYTVLNDTLVRTLVSDANLSAEVARVMAKVAIEETRAALNVGAGSKETAPSYAQQMKEREAAGVGADEFLVDPAALPPGEVGGEAGSDASSDASESETESETESEEYNEHGYTQESMNRPFRVVRSVPPGWRGRTLYMCETLDGAMSTFPTTILDIHTLEGFEVTMSKRVDSEWETLRTWSSGEPLPVDVKMEIARKQELRERHQREEYERKAQLAMDAVGYTRESVLKLLAESDDVDATFTQIVTRSRQGLDEILSVLQEAAVQGFGDPAAIRQRIKDIQQRVRDADDDFITDAATNGSPPEETGGEMAGSDDEDVVLPVYWSAFYDEYGEGTHPRQLFEGETPRWTVNTTQRGSLSADLGELFAALNASLGPPTTSWVIGIETDTGLKFCASQHFTSETEPTVAEVCTAIEGEIFVRRWYESRANQREDGAEIGFICDIVLRQHDNSEECAAVPFGYFSCNDTSSVVRSAYFTDLNLAEQYFEEAKYWCTRWARQTGNLSPAVVIQNARNQDRVVNIFIGEDEEDGQVVRQYEMAERDEMPYDFLTGGPDEPEQEDFPEHIWQRLNADADDVDEDLAVLLESQLRQYGDDGAVADDDFITDAATNGSPPEETGGEAGSNDEDSDDGAAAPAGRRFFADDAPSQQEAANLAFEQAYGADAHPDDLLGYGDWSMHTRRHGDNWIIEIETATFTFCVSDDFETASPTGPGISEVCTEIGRDLIVLKWYVAYQAQSALPSQQDAANLAFEQAYGADAHPRTLLDSGEWTMYTTRHGDTWRIEIDTGNNPLNENFTFCVSDDFETASPTGPGIGEVGIEIGRDVIVLKWYVAYQAQSALPGSVSNAEPAPDAAPVEDRGQESKMLRYEEVHSDVLEVVKSEGNEIATLVEYDDTMAKTGEQECPHTLEPFEIGEKIVLTKCFHRFSVEGFRAQLCTKTTHSERYFGEREGAKDVKVLNEPTLWYLESSMKCAVCNRFFYTPANLKDSNIQGAAAALQRTNDEATMRRLKADLSAWLEWMAPYKGMSPKEVTTLLRQRGGKPARLGDTRMNKMENIKKLAEMDFAEIVGDDVGSGRVVSVPLEAVSRLMVTTPESSTEGDALEQQVLSAFDALQVPPYDKGTLMTALLGEDGAARERFTRLSYLVPVFLSPEENVKCAGNLLGFLSEGKSLGIDVVRVLKELLEHIDTAFIREDGSEIDPDACANYGYGHREDFIQVPEDLARRFLNETVPLMERRVLQDRVREHMRVAEEVSRGSGPAAE